MGEFLAFILKGLGKMLLWLLFKVGMWIPALFTVLFFVVMAITGTEFSVIGGLFWFGLIATAFLGIALSAYRAVKKAADKKKKGDRSNLQQVKKDEQAKEESVAPAQPVAPPASAYPVFSPQSPAPYPQPAYNGQPVYGYPPQSAPYGYASDRNYPPQQERPAQSSEQPGFIPYPKQTEPGTVNQDDRGFIPYPRQSTPPSTDGGFIPYNRTSQYRDSRDFTREPRDYGDDRRQAPSFERPSRPSFDRANARGEGETPRVYRTRKDETVLIYDYSDRVEFYRISPSGLTFLYSEKKHGA